MSSDLTAELAAALRLLARYVGRTESEVIEEALVIYEQAVRASRAGHQVVTINGRTGEQTVVLDAETFETRVARIQARFAALPTLDDRTPDEILGYDEDGLPT